MNMDHDAVIVVSDDHEARDRYQDHYRRKYEDKWLEVVVLPEWDHLRCMMLIEELYARGRLKEAVWGKLTSAREVHRQACKKYHEYLASLPSETIKKAA